MGAKMSLQSRLELLGRVHARYAKAEWKEKVRILDEFVEATGYHRNYAVQLLNAPAPKSRSSAKRKRPSQYTEEVRQALFKVWMTANQICSKRLVPFLPDFVPALERSGYLKISHETRSQLLSLSAATVDRLLGPERKRLGGGRATTKRGSLLKKQIPVRTFAEWDNVVAGFVEADLVAHCGETVAGSFLNSLVLTDIATTWTEFLPILYKNEANVLEALQVARDLLPFPLKGLDTDNGSEFINNALLAFCQKEQITFTRSRPYKKNDQAHVEEKNGSIVRRMIGYDRYEGARAYTALDAVYEKLRLYVNFFQPSMKLVSKERIGAKVRKKYDKAQTPYQRALASASVDERSKDALRKQMLQLDPVLLFQQVERLQEVFWKHAWKRGSSLGPVCAVSEAVVAITSTPCKDGADQGVPALDPQPRRYRKTDKPRKKMAPRTWKTWTDVFAPVALEIEAELRKDPTQGASSILKQLQAAHPGQFEDKLLRTLQRRVAAWRKECLTKEQASLTIIHRDAAPPVVSSLKAKC
jgi:hypothetical protein